MFRSFEKTVGFSYCLGFQKLLFRVSNWCVEDSGLILSGLIGYIFRVYTVQDIYGF